MVENFLTKKSKSEGLVPTLFLVTLLIVGTTIFLNELVDAEKWMPASNESVFKNKEWWRPWTTLFAHGDLGHVSSNLFLFIPFSYFLTSTFGLFLFPVVGFLIGGIINMIVLTTLSENSILIGVSGVVYWMGACWITLSFLIDKRESLTRRIIKSIGITLILFFPEALKPEISYFSHFLGLFFGVICGAIYYLTFRKKIRAADVYQLIVEPDWQEELLWEPEPESKLEQPSLDDSKKNSISLH